MATREERIRAMELALRDAERSQTAEQRTSFALLAFAEAQAAALAPFSLTMGVVGGVPVKETRPAAPEEDG